jgi:DNA/RNA-binding domain of Phe-tRNA-synthetase-like protein
MEFIAHPEIFARFPGIRIAIASAEGLDNATPRPQIEAAWREAWAAAATAAAPYGNAQSHPRIAPWRERFKAQGISGKEFPSSAEALLRRALKGGEPFTINPLVDWYNALSLRHFVPAGAFDLGQLAGPVELRLTTEGDTFFALDAPEAIPVPAGEVAYTDGHTVITRHFIWRQSRAGLISHETTHALLLSEILGEVGEAVANAMLSDFLTGLRDYFGVNGRGAIIDADHSTFVY